MESLSFKYRLKSQYKTTIQNMDNMACIYTIHWASFYMQSFGTRRTKLVIMSNNLYWQFSLSLTKHHIIKSFIDNVFKTHT